MITTVITVSFPVQVKRSETGHSGAKLQKVDLQVIINHLPVCSNQSFVSRVYQVEHPLAT